MKALTLLVLVVACGGGNDGDGPDGNTATADAKEFHDAPPVVAQMIALSGETTERGLSGTTKVAAVTVAAFKISDESTPVAMATSDAQGKYTLNVPTGGAPFDGFLKATKSGYIDIYLYPSSSWIEDFTDGEINMLTPGNKDLLNNFASGGQTAGKGMVGLAVLDASGNPVAGATISAAPGTGTVRYTGSNGLPSATATVTSADGVAFVFNAPETVTVSAAKSGMSFREHAVKAHADKFTTTSIAP
jgi:hypothetical protein